MADLVTATCQGALWRLRVDATRVCLPQKSADVVDHLKSGSPGRPVFVGGEGPQNREVPPVDRRGNKKFSVTEMKVKLGKKELRSQWCSRAMHLDLLAGQPASHKRGKKKRPSDQSLV